MKVLHVIYSVDPRSGGPTNALRQMVCAQRDAGHEIAVLTTTTQSAEPWALQDDYIARMSADRSFDGVELTILQAFGRRRPWSRWAYTPAADRFLRTRLGDSNKRPDVVHIHGTFSHLVTVAARCARRAQVPYVLRPHGNLNAKCLALGFSPLKRLFIRLLLSRDLERAAAIQAMSEKEAVELAKVAEQSRIRVVPHGVDLPSEGTEGGTRNLFLDRYPETRGRRRILFLSRLHAKKRVGLLVEALARLREEIPDAMLVIAGSDAGDLNNVINQAQKLNVSDRVLFCGFLEGEMKSAAFRAADVFALPSIDENFGFAVVEAMAHAAPVLVTPEVATNAYVEASGGGLTVDGTVDALTIGLRRMLSEDRLDWGDRGREYVMKNLAWPAVVRQLEAIYE